MARIVSVSTVALDGYPLHEALDEIAAAGAEYVELAFIHGYSEFDETAFTDSSAALHRRMIEERGLRTVALSAHISLSLPENGPALLRRIHFARGIGANIVITNAGDRSGKDAFRRNIDSALAELESSQVTLAIENPGHGDDDLMRTGAEGAELAREIGSPWVRLNYDVGNVLTCTRAKVRPELDIASALPLACHVHAKDVRVTDDGYEYVAVGSGDIDYARICDNLDQSPNPLPVALELPIRLRRRKEPLPSRAAAPEPLDRIRAVIASSLSFWRSGD